MGEEVRITDYDVPVGGSGEQEEDDERVAEWEDGLPNGDDLTPLSQSLISSELLSAFNITPEPYQSMIDVNSACQNTLSSLRGESEFERHSFTRFDTRTSLGHGKGEETADLTAGGSDVRKLERIGSGGDGDGECDGGGAVEETESDDPSARVSKRPRLVWTPQLHKRFIEVVAHLGVKNAVPKTIMHLMNVEGLTRENVASHLQKYRLYLKRMQSLPAQGSSSSNHRFGAQNSQESAAGDGNGYYPPPAGTIPVPYAPQMIQHMVPNSQQRRNWSGMDSVAGYHSGMTHKK